MKIAQIKNKARTFGIKADNMKRDDIIHAIQAAEGNTPCFGTAKGQCPYLDCCFIEDCLRVKN